MVVPTMLDGRDVSERYEKIVIENNIFQIKLMVHMPYRGRYSYEYNFKLSDNHFTLIEVDVVFLNGRTFDWEETMYNFLSKKGTVKMRSFDRGGDRQEKLEIKEFDIMVHEKMTLDNMQQFLTWKVAPDKFL
jgi:hypothetical protein